MEPNGLSLDGEQPAPGSPARSEVSELILDVDETKELALTSVWDCAVCAEVLPLNLEGSKSHKYLKKVLICEECDNDIKSFKVRTSPETGPSFSAIILTGLSFRVSLQFSRDDDGVDADCRMCCGRYESELFLCANPKPKGCKFAFCVSCVERALGESEAARIREDGMRLGDSSMSLPR
jgi:hypothetical protein